jgi:hypothetical protein
LLDGRGVDRVATTVGQDQAVELPHRPQQPPPGEKQPRPDGERVLAHGHEGLVRLDPLLHRQWRVDQPDPSMAADFGPRSIAVNAICPGFIITRMAKDMHGGSQYETE